MVVPQGWGGLRVLETKQNGKIGRCLAGRQGECFVQGGVHEMRVNVEDSFVRCSYSASMEIVCMKVKAPTCELNRELSRGCRSTTVVEVGGRWLLVLADFVKNAWIK